MTFKYEMTDRDASTGEYDPPDRRAVQEVRTVSVTDAVEAFNDFITGIYGAGWRVELVETGQFEVAEEREYDFEDD